MSDIVVIVDADILAFRMAAACEKRGIRAISPTGASKEYKNKTEFKDYLKTIDKLHMLDRFTIEPYQYDADLGRACGMIDGKIEQIKEFTFADRIKFCVSGKSNFRDNLALPKKYKGDRSESLRPLYLRECKGYLYKNFDTEASDGSESDDYVIFRGYEELEKGNEVIIGTCDKDSNAYSGLKLLDFTKKNEDWKIVDIPRGVGSLWLNEKKDSKGKVTTEVDGIGFKFYAHQMLIGDSVDHYRPTDICKERFGEKSSYAILKDLTSERECLEAVAEQYRTWYPHEFTYTDWMGVEHKSDYLDMLCLYHMCCRMKETIDDTLDFKLFAARYGVKL